MHTALTACRTKLGETRRAAERRTAARVAQIVVRDLVHLEARRTISFPKDALGKPHIHIDGVSRNDIHMSISHAYPHVFVIAEKGARLVGCDVERIRQFSRPTARAFLTKNEQANIARLPQQSRAYYETLCWSTKEAVLKALGCGLRLHPAHVDTAALATQRIPAYITVAGKKRRAFIWHMRLGKGYVAVAVALAA